MIKLKMEKTQVKFDITVRTLICLAILLAQTSAQEADTLKYKAFHDQCSRWGYSWEAYTVVTEDQWELALFRLINENNELDKLIDDVVVEIEEENKIKIPILF